METHGRITALALARAYERLGFHLDQQDSDTSQLTFRRTEDRMMFFHHTLHGEAYWAIVLHDIRDTEALHGSSEGIADKLQNILFELEILP